MESAISAHTLQIIDVYYTCCGNAIEQLVLKNISKDNEIETEDFAMWKEFLRIR